MTWVREQATTPIPVRAAHRGGLDRVDHPGRDAVPVTARAADGRPVGAPRAWVMGRGDGDAGIWRRHAERFDRTGLWPLLSCGPEHLFLDDRSPDELVPADAARVLSRGWEGTRLVAPDGTRLPHPAWPGLAAASGEATDVVVLPTLPWVFGDLLLVPATRPADSIAQLGWYGAGNWSLAPTDVAGVLRSWEDRFGAYVVGVGPADLDVVVTRPPLREEQCRVLADEHFAFCPDNFFPQTIPEQEAIPPERYALALRGARTWHFWWD
jgi:hypothetical protein